MYLNLCAADNLIFSSMASVNASAKTTESSKNFKDNDLNVKGIKKNRFEEKGSITAVTNEWGLL